MPPRFTQDGPAPHQHHHGAGVGGRHRQDQCLLLRAKPKRGAIPGGKGAAGAGGTEPGHGADRLGHRGPQGHQPAAPEPTHQPIRWRGLAQDRGQVSRVDVLPFQAPVEACYHHCDLLAGCQGCGGCDVDAIGMQHLDVWRCRPQAGQGRHHGSRRWPGVGGAPIAQVGGVRQPADHRQGADSCQWQQGGFVPEQHDRLGGRFPGQGPVVRATAHRIRIGARRHRVLGFQHAQHSVIDPCHRDPASGHRIRQRGRKDHPKGHLQVLPSQQGFIAVANPEDEIGDDKAAEPPALLEDIGEQVDVLAAPGPVDAVVSAHHRKGAGLHAVAELGQVELLKHPLAGEHIQAEAGAVD